MKYKTCIRMVWNYLTFLPRATCRLRGNGSSGSKKVLTFQKTTKYPLSCLTVRGSVNVGGVVSRKQGPIDYKKIKLKTWHRLVNFTYYLGKILFTVLKTFSIIRGVCTYILC